MRRIKVIVLALGMLILVNPNVFAGDIEQGAISVGVSSNLNFTQSQSESEYNDKKRDTTFSAEMGYFFAKNLEIGAGLGFNYGDRSGGGSSYSYALNPFVGYHWSLNEKSNIYARVGGGFQIGKSSDDGWEADSKRSNIFGEVGYEFFLLDNIALDLSCVAKRYWTEISNEDDDSYWDEEDTNTHNIVTTQLKFKLYF